MDGSSAKKSTSFETLVIQNIANVNDLKTKLQEIIRVGQTYEFDVSSCMKSLLKSSDREIVLLTVQAISELAKCEDNRERYAQRDIIEPLINILQKEIVADTISVFKHSFRSLGNLCCDCDTARDLILECNGVQALITVLDRSLQDKTLNELKLLASKTLLNCAIGGQPYSEFMTQNGLTPLLHKMFVTELERDDMDYDVVSTALLLISVINDNSLEFLFEPELNTAVLNVLKETTNVEISELCLDHLHNQAEHDSVKTLLAKEHAVQVVCSRLEQLVQKHEAGKLNTEEVEVETLMKQACDLVIIVLTGDEAMHILYENGTGEVYTTMVRWLQSNNQHLLATAVLAIGNFARQDDYCTRMMDQGIFDTLLDLFEVHNALTIQQQSDSDKQSEAAKSIKIQHALLSAIRNLTVPVGNKRTAADKGRAAPLLIEALPNVTDHHVAYKMLAAIRMLVDGQESVAAMLTQSPSALSAVSRWGGSGHAGGAAAEAPRLLAWAVRLLRGGGRGWQPIVEVDGCISCLVNMLVACHSVMQNEAILALTLLTIESLKTPTELDVDYEKNFITQLIKSEIGKHISVLIDTNCAKLPLEVAENLVVFLDMTSKKNGLISDFREANVQGSLQKFVDTRRDLSDHLKRCIANIVSTISDNGSI